MRQGRPSGTAVQFMFRFGGLGFGHFGSRVRTWHCLSRHAVAGVPYIKYRKMGTDVSSGQSSSEKRGGLAADVSSGLIFLERKRKCVGGWTIVIIVNFCLFLMLRIKALSPVSGHLNLH